MEKLAEYIEGFGVEKSDSLIDKSKINEIESVCGVTIGNDLADYILNYGYLIYSSVELYGITARQGAESDMVTQTLYLHKYFAKTRGYVALENQGEGDYYLVDSEDRVFEYDSELDELTDTKLSLEDYILSRFHEVE